ncbi:MAG: discoidin domain-containing protein, partial [Bacteroidales bacterium]|nr:discoidin domain-containing protein [Bacteroidales bacterium]
MDGLCLALLLAGCGQPTAAPEGGYTRGIGVYPGEPAAYTGPETVPAGEELRNLALHRVARHSSSYDYNLTAQLVTDGIHAKQLPYWIEMDLNGEALPKRDRERLFDGNTWTPLTIQDGTAELTLRLHEGTARADRLTLMGAADGKADQCALVLEVSPDGEHWKPVKTLRERPFPTGRVPRGERVNWRNYLWTLDLPAEPFAALRLRIDAPGLRRLTVQQWDFTLKGQPVDVLPSARFCSAWMSAGAEDEWVCVDLGAEASLEKLRLDWLAGPAAGVVESSADGETWTRLADLPQESGEIAVQGRGRYVRLSGLKAAGEHLILSEMEVWGRGGVVPQAQP